MALTTPIMCRGTDSRTRAPQRKDLRTARTRFGKRTLPVDIERLEAATKGVRLRVIGRRGGG